MYKSFKVRLYPTKQQEVLMWKHIHSCRFIWNCMLALQNERYKNGEKHLSRFDMMKCLTPLKKEEQYSWLNEVSNTSLQIVCTDLAQAFTEFFNKKHSHPKFKSRKKAKNNFPISAENTNTWFDGKYTHIPKVGKVKYKADKDLPIGRGVTKIINPRISNKNGKWMLYFTVECENQVHDLTDKPMGIDLGIKETMTVAYGDESIVFHNINKSRTIRLLNKQTKHLQRSISRKYEANRKGKKFIKTRNIERAEDKLRKLYARLTNIRNNYNHHCTHKLVSLLPSRVVMEDLNVQGMLKNKHLSRAIIEQCFYEITRQMKYKCEWNNIPFYQVDRFYPSSKTCCKCGCVKSNLKLSDRTYICSECGNVIDRDLNAAINLQRYVG